MKNKKGKIILFIVLGLIAILLAIFVVKIVTNKNKLTVSERHWIDENNKTTLNVNVINDANIFGSDGTGVFYDFLEDFKEEYNLVINPITFTYGNSKDGVSFDIKHELGDNDISFYEDHYVLISKNVEIINSIDYLNNKKIGILNSDLNYLLPYLTNANSYAKYGDKTGLLNALASGEVSYAIVPLDYYLSDILKNNYEINFHLSDVKYYYTLSLTNDKFSSVLRKYYNTWKKFDKSYNEQEFALFQENLNIADSEIDSLRSEVLKYGLLNTSPYEVIKSGNYGGIVAVTLKKFSMFSDTEFNFNNYRNYNKFSNAINNGKIDLYFDRYNFKPGDTWSNVGNIFNIKYNIIASRDNNLVVNSINSLKNSEVYVEEGSILYDYLSTIKGIKIVTYKNENELLKLNRKNVVILIDSNIYNYYANTKLNNYTSRYYNEIDKAYSFKVNGNKTLQLLLNKYISTLDKNALINEGLDNHYETMKTGIILSTIAKYFIYLLIAFVILTFILVRKSKKVYIAKKVKRDDKLKYIDQLTSLKNRNYLNECIDNWNNNSVYPQTIVVVDLNNLQEINDLDGYSEGDKQIKACANVLIRTQLDNSEIMRTDGNEFVMYLVGYNQKQVSNYIRKLNKEMDKLPYKNGAEFGYSTIEDDIKTIEDALNEAVEDMKNRKKDRVDEGKN